MTTEHKEYIDSCYEQVSKETKERLEGKSGIYAIYCNDEIVYIGKSTDLLKRFIAHKAHIFCPFADEYNRPKYKELRRAIDNGFNIRLDMLEECGDGELGLREAVLIQKYVPALNTQIPEFYNNSYRKKRISKIC